MNSGFSATRLSLTNRPLSYSITYSTIPTFEDYPYHAIHRRMHTLTDAGIEIADPLDRFVESGELPRAYWSSPDDCHKNYEAHRIIAGVVADVILSTSGERLLDWPSSFPMDFEAATVVGTADSPGARLQCGDSLRVRNRFARSIPHF